MPTTRTASPASIDTAAAPARRVGEIRHDWSTAEVEALFALPFSDLLYEAQRVHRE